MTTNRSKFRKNDHVCQVGETCVIWDSARSERCLNTCGVNTSKTKYRNQCHQCNYESSICPLLCNPPKRLCGNCQSGPSGEAVEKEPKCQQALIGSKFSKCRCSTRDGLQDRCDLPCSVHEKEDSTDNDNCNFTPCPYHLPAYQPPYCCYANDVPPTCCCGNTLLSNSCSYDSPAQENSIADAEHPKVKEGDSSSSSSRSKENDSYQSPKESQPKISKSKPCCGVNCRDPCMSTRCTEIGPPVVIGQVIPLAPSPPYPLCAPPPLVFAQDADCNSLVEMYGDPVCCCPGHCR